MKSSAPVRFLQKVFSSLLIISLFVSPVAQVFAQEAVDVIQTETTQIEQPSLSAEINDPVILDTSTDIEQVLGEPVNNPIESNEETIKDILDTGPVKEDVITPEITDEPAEEVIPVNEEEEPQMMMSQSSGGFFGDTRDATNLSLPQTDQSTGGLTYEYPLTVPPGRNGLNPKVSLKYSSQDADQASIFGYGWSVNIPYIERVNKSGIEKLYTDNYFNSSLSGELVNTSGGDYAPKTENGDFLKYSLSSNVWTVTDKQGTVYKFGLTSNSREDDTGNSSNVGRWMLEEIRDTNDNYIEYSYYKDAGQVYPDTITYTGNNTTDGIFSVVFTRSSRSDAITQNKYGFGVTTNYKITDIQSKVSGTWRHKYVLAYTTGDNTQRSLLNTITESGQDESSNVTTLPAVAFTYQATGTGSEFVTDFAWSTAVSASINTAANFGAIVADLNGDALPDLMESTESAGVWTKGTYLNDGDGSWTYTSALNAPTPFSCPCAPGGHMMEEGIRAADVNGDGRADIVQSGNTGGGQVSRTYINQGTSWYLDSNWAPAGSFLGNTNDTGTRLVDINGDGLPDFINALGDNNGAAPITTTVSLNTGNGWSSDSGWVLPVDMRLGVILVDYNGDGLVDILKGHKNSSNVETKIAYKNNGDKTWSEDTSYTPPIVFGVSDNGSLSTSTGTLFGDINGDGLIDILSGSTSTNGAYLNKSPGWQFTTNSQFPLAGIPLTTNPVTRLTDFDGDGMLDFYDSAQSSATLSKNQRIKADLLSTIMNRFGGVSTVTYKSSPKYASGGATLNPHLPAVLDTVYQIATTSGFSNPTITKTYSYQEGDYYFNTHLDRKITGFGKIIEDDGTTKTTNYFHQGNSTNSSQGEYSDHISKAGKIYRTEIADTSNNIYQKTVNKWDKYNQGTGRDFVKLVRSTVLSYDGDSDHKDTTTEYTYDDTYGNITTKTMWGEVTGSDDGSYTDTGTDKTVETITYTANTTDWIVGLPYQDTVVDQSAAKVRETKTYYDAQSLGTVTDGNPTKVEKWKVSSTYVNTQKGYNTTYGIPTSSTDERGKVTSYTYDANYLYPATVTDPLSNDTDYTYDYASGNIKQVTEPNGFVYQRTYDGLDRVLTEKVPDFGSPYSAVTKTAYTYTDTSGAVAVQKTDNLDGSNSVDSYTYLDGLNRKIQDRTESESSYVARDYLYNNVGLLQKESLPYDSSGTSRTTATSTTALYKTYTYDPMQRYSTVVDAVGTTNYTYDDWKTTTTDPRSKVKNYYKDAHDNLIKVEEVNSGSTYITNYEWNLNKKLTKITDALSNFRNFTYDGLGRRLTAEDLHASGDATFGSWSYTYDDASNMIQSVSPEAKTVNYTYDDINRVLTENETVGSGTEITYTYDSCMNGIGKVCAVDMLAGADTDYTYDSNGNTVSEVKTINSNAYTTSHTYDRLGNKLVITYPDSAQIKYTYNTAGQLEKVERKENGGSYTDVVSDFDYGPHGKITYQMNSNGTNTTNTYDETKIYRLTRKYTSYYSGGTPTTVTFYPAAGDGYVYNDNTNWDTGHDATSGVVSSYTGTTFYTGNGKASATSYRIRRAFLPFDTSSLPDDAVISDAKLKTYINSKLNNDNDGDDWVTVVQTSQPSNTALANSDFDLAGSINNPTEGVDTGERKDITSVSTSAYLTFNLNTTGKGWVNKTGFTKLGLREGHDVIDSPFTGTSGQNNYLIIRAGEYSGTSSDPKLEVTYSIPSTTIFQDIAYTYDENGNITQIIDNSNTDASKTVAYVYDDLNRMTSATATSVAGGQSTYIQSYFYDAIGNITSSPLGSYTYAGSTGSNYANPHAITFINDVVSNNNPTITLSGSSLIDLNVNDTWTEPGYSASDFEDGTITSDVTVTGSVNTAVSGVYQLIYNVEDSADAPAPGKIRTIVVHDPYVPPSLSVKALVVAGGGSGGQASMYYSGGGGAGGVLYHTSHSVTAQAYSITVGSGGNSWSNGGNSVFSSLTAVGGGRGGSLSAGSKHGNSGGSGGGGSADGSGGSGTSGQGYAGGGSWLNSGGGGGATGAGQTGGSSAPASNGGPGFTTDISGTSVCYAGGGGGVRNGGSPGDGTCGGGDGSYSGESGTSNTGGGGGGNGYSGSQNGGSGIVIVTYKTDGSDGVSNTSTGGTVSTSGAYTIHKFTSSGTFTVVASSVPPPNDNPVITLTGSDLIDLDVNDTWTEPGYSAADTEDGTITGDVDVTGTVNTAIAGTYQLIYNVEDSIGNSAPGKIRTVVVHAPSGEITYTYDKDGNLLDDETLANTWNYKQQLIESDNGVDVLEYWYDHEGQRVRAKNDSDNTYYANKLYNVDPSGKETKSIYAGDALVSTIETISTVVSPYYVHTDHLGGTNVVTDDTGAQVELLDYFPYGDQRISSGSFTNAKQYIGQEYDEDTQLSYLNARYYNGARGQFISQDPEFWVTSLDWLLDPQNQNSYAYARNNPITLSDPTGRSVYAVSKEIENNSAGTHVFLLIAPNNPGDFGMKSGDAWTLGGYAGDNGNLIKGRNAPSDVSVVQNGYSMPDQQKGKMKSTVQVQMPSGVSDTEFIKNITNQYNAYNEDAAYDPFVNNGYNSNNFATTLLRGAGVENLPWNGNAPGIDPGYGQAIPSNYVKANGTMGAANLSAVSNYGSRETGRQVGGAINRATQAVSNGVRTIINKIKGN